MALLPRRLITNYTRKRLPETVQLAFLKRLLHLFENGYSLVRALEVMKWDNKLEGTALILEEKLMAGEWIDQAFEQASFHPTITSYLYLTRVNGDIETSVANCIRMFEHRMRQLNKFKRVIRYPVMLCVVLFMLLFFLKASVLPAFANVFQVSNSSTNTISISIFTIDFLITAAICLGAINLFSLFFWMFYRRNIPIDRRILFYKKIPVYRSFLRLQTSYYIATYISMFLKTGMSMKDVIANMARQRKLPIVAYYAELMMAELTNGFYVDQLLERLPLIEGQLASLFRRNSNVKGLERDLTLYADFLTEQMEDKIMKGIAMIQPIFFTFLAGMIMFIYLALMWPMFQLIQTM